MSSIIPSGEKGKQTMDALGLSFLYCHPVSLYEWLTWAVIQDSENITLDFFAGSGTTAHAIINLNRKDNCKRKYILIEVEGYFDTVLKSRVKKTIYAENWKKKKPVTRDSKFSHIIKYQRIESYEDALNNIEFNEIEHKNLFLNEHHLSYMLESDTRESPTLLNISKLQNPFSYQLNIVKDMQTQEQSVDLLETFNYLLGLSVQTRQCLYDDDRRYLIYKGKVGQKVVVIIWRETEGWVEQDWKRDHDFIEEQKLTKEADKVYVNTDSIIPEAESLDSTFQATHVFRIKSIEKTVMPRRNNSQRTLDSHLTLHGWLNNHFGYKTTRRPT